MNSAAATHTSKDHNHGGPCITTNRGSHLSQKTSIFARWYKLFLRNRRCQQ